MKFAQKLDHVLSATLFEAEPETTPSTPETPSKPEVAEVAPDKPKKIWPGDKIYHIINKDTGKTLVKNPYTNKSFRSDIEAQGFIDQHADNPGMYDIQQVDNPRSLTTLKKTMKPIDLGWTEEEVMQAFEPRVYSVARRYERLFPGHEEDLRQQARLGVLTALKGTSEDGKTPLDQGLSPFGLFAEKYLRNFVLRYIVANRSAITGPRRTGAQSNVVGGGGGLIGYEVVWMPTKEGKGVKELADFKFFPRAQYKEAKEFEKKLKADGNITMINKRRGEITSADKPVGGGDEGEGTALGKGIPGSEKTPSYLSAQRDTVKKLKNLARKLGMTDKQEQIFNMRYGLDVPETGAGRLKWGDAGSREASRFGPPESGEEGRKPGEQSGKTPEEAGFDPKRVEKREEGDYASRNLADIVRSTGLSGERVRQQLQKAHHYMMLAAQKAMPELMKKKEEGKATPAECRFLDGLIILERKLSKCLIEMYMIDEALEPLFG